MNSLSLVELISHGEVGKALGARLTMTTHLRLPEGKLVSPTYFNKISDNNKLEIDAFSNNVDIMHLFTKKLLFTQKHIFVSICLTVDNTCSVYKEIIENNDNNKEFNQVFDMVSKCSTNSKHTSASKPHYNPSSQYS